LELAFIRMIMKRLHRCVNPFLSHPFLVADIVRIVFVLDQPPIPKRAPLRSIHLAVVGIICFGDAVRATIFLDGGLLVGR